MVRYTPHVLAVVLVLGAALSHRFAPVSDPASSVEGGAAQGSDIRKKVEPTAAATHRRPSPPELKQDAPASAQGHHPRPVAEPLVVERAWSSRELMDEVMEVEEVDPDWGPGAEEDIVERFSELAPPEAQLVEARCRATLCRVELGLDPDALDVEDDVIDAVKAWNSNGLYVAESGPDVRIVVYMAREGLTLPRI